MERPRYFIGEPKTHKKTPAWQSMPEQVCENLKPIVSFKLLIVTAGGRIPLAIEPFGGKLGKVR